MLIWLLGFSKATCNAVELGLQRSFGRPRLDLLYGFVLPNQPQNGTTFPLSYPTIRSCGKTSELDSYLSAFPRRLPGEIIP